MDTDIGTVYEIEDCGTTIDLDPDSSALIIDGDGTCSVYIPQSVTEQDIVPDNALTVTAMITRFQHDPAWGRELIQWLCDYADKTVD